MQQIIGELAFGETFGTLANEKPHYMMQYLHDSNVSTGIMIRAVWIIMVFRTIPIINRGLQQFLDFSETAMEKRLKVPSPVLLRPIGDELSKPSYRELINRETSLLGFGTTFLLNHLRR